MKNIFIHKSFDQDMDVFIEKNMKKIDFEIHPDFFYQQLIQNYPEAKNFFDINYSYPKKRY